MLFVDAPWADECVETKEQTSNREVKTHVKPIIKRNEPFEVEGEKSYVADSKETQFENEFRHSRPTFELVPDGEGSGDLDSSEKFRQSDRTEVRPLLSVRDKQLRRPVSSGNGNVDHNDQHFIPSVVAHLTNPNTIHIGQLQTGNSIDQEPSVGISDSLEQELNKPPTISHEQIVGVNVAETPGVFALEQEMAKTPKPSQVEEKQINVHIGRIEIKAIKEPAAQKRTKAKRPAIGGLDDYLKLQSERSRQ